MYTAGFSTPRVLFAGTTGTHGWLPHLKNWSLQGRICQGDS